MINNKKAYKNGSQAQKNNAKLWQSISETEQNTLKGGWPLPWPFGPGGGYASSANCLDGQTLQ